MFEKKKTLRIMLVCGGGVCSSSLVKPMVEDMLDEMGLRYQLIQGSYVEIKNYSNIDLVLTTLTVMPSDVLALNLPIVSVASIFKGQTDDIKANIHRALDDGETGMIG